MKKLATFTSIVTHPGSSHNDEILATAIAIASQGDVVPVFRRDPSTDDLQDQETLVLDQGGRIDNWSNNFDHHQFDRNAPAECTFTLIAKELGVDDSLESFFPWYRTWSEIDAHGPFAWAKQRGLDWDQASSLLNPLDEMVHEWWEENDDDGQVDPALVKLLLKVGTKILGATERFQEFCAKADVEEICGTTIRGVRVFDLTCFSAEDALEFGDAYAKLKGVEGGVLVSMDNRGPGFSLFRRSDDPRVDFSVLNGNPAVIFAHKDGFIAKTAKPEGWRPLVEAAIKD